MLKKKICYKDPVMSSIVKLLVLQGAYTLLLLPC